MTYHVEQTDSDLFFNLSVGDGNYGWETKTLPKPLTSTTVDQLQLTQKHGALSVYKNLNRKLHFKRNYLAYLRNSLIADMDHHD